MTKNLKYSVCIGLVLLAAHMNVIPMGDNPAVDKTQQALKDQPASLFTRPETRDAVRMCSGIVFTAGMIALPRSKGLVGAVVSITALIGSGIGLAVCERGARGTFDTIFLHEDGSIKGKKAASIAWKEALNIYNKKRQEIAEKAADKDPKE